MSAVNINPGDTHSTPFFRCSICSFVFELEFRGFCPQCRNEVQGLKRDREVVEMKHLPPGYPPEEGIVRKLPGAVHLRVTPCGCEVSKAQMEELFGGEKMTEGL